MPHGAVVHAPLAVDAVDAGDGRDHAGHEAAGGAGLADVHGDGVGVLARLPSADALDEKRAPPGFDDRAQEAQALGRAGQVLAFEDPFEEGLSPGQGRADERPVGQGLGRGGRDGDDVAHACSWVIPAP